MKNKMIELKCAMEDYISLCESIDDNAGRDMDELYRLESDISNRIVSDKFNMLNNAIQFSNREHQYCLDNKIVNMEQVTILDHDALYIDAGVISTIDEYKTFQSRHSDDGDEYFCEIAPIITVNNSGTFVVTKDSYNDIFKNGELDYVILDPLDVSEIKGIVPIRFADGIPNNPFLNGVLDDISQQLISEEISVSKKEIYELGMIVLNTDSTWKDYDNHVHDILIKLSDR